MTGTGIDEPHAVRKKSSEACERCREKRIKCNGLLPCDQCQKKEARCVFATTPAMAKGHENLSTKLDLVLGRLDRLEQSLARKPEFFTHHTRSISRQIDPVDMQPKGLTQLNQQTGCFEYYGNTSTFVLASSLAKKVRQIEEITDVGPVAKRRRLEHSSGSAWYHSDKIRDTGLDDLTAFGDYVVPPNVMRHDRVLRSNVADRHLENFFQTIHFLIPLFDQAKFEKRYQIVRPLFGDRRLFFPSPDDPSRPQFVCLLYAVLAHGALYENERDDSSSWASWYFAEAQDMLGRLLEAANLQLVQAALLLGAYAQHAIKSNLAYILTGTATRLAFSIGLNIGSVHKTLPYDVEESRRTYWMIYVQEVELSLDSGRPMSFPTSQLGVEYPEDQLDNGGGTALVASPTTFIRYLVDVTRIVRRILKLVNMPEYQQGLLAPEETELWRQELEDWYTSLPEHLKFQRTSEDTAIDDSIEFLYSWKQRQQSSLRIHFNLAKIVLLRGSFQNPTSRPSKYDNASLLSFHQASGLEAARDMIKHIHKLFKMAPRLRRWSYYCFYSLQATLIVLQNIAERRYNSRLSTLENERLPLLRQTAENLRPVDYSEDWKLCSLAVETFEQIQLKASQRCADVVRNFLEKWEPFKPEYCQQEAGLAQTTTPSSVFRLPRFTAPELSLFSQTAVQRIANQLPETSHKADIANKEVLSPSIPATANSSMTSPSIYLSNLQAELYGAFYNDYSCNDEAFGQPDSFHNFNNQVISSSMDVMSNTTWPQFERRGFEEDCARLE